MNKPRPYRNESNPEDKMTRKDLKEMEVTTYTNKVHLPFCCLNHRNSKAKCALRGAIHVG